MISLVCFVVSMTIKFTKIRSFCESWPRMHVFFYKQVLITLTFHPAADAEDWRQQGEGEIQQDQAWQKAALAETL